MAVFKRLTKEQIDKDYDYYGLMYGLVPVYVGDPYGEARICVRNWYPEWLLDLTDAVFGLASMTMQLINPEHAPLFFFKLGEKIKKQK